MLDFILLADSPSNPQHIVFSISPLQLAPLGLHLQLFMQPLLPLLMLSRYMETPNTYCPALTSCLHDFERLLNQLKWES